MRATDEMGERLDALEAAIAELRALVQRAYENPLGAAAEVMRARRDPSYADAYGPEPLVTARIGAYRGGDILIERALASIRAQTYENWEAIVVCDGREPETAAAIAALGDPRVRCVQRPRNGPYPEDRSRRWQVAGCNPFNQAVALGRGAWIAPLDQDDEWAPDHLDILLESARESGGEVVFGVSRVDLGEEGETWFGDWPPRLGNFGFQAAIYHAGLAALLYNVNSHLVDEPADWNLARRMTEAGVTFEFVDRFVTTYFVSPDDAAWDFWVQRRDELGAYRAGSD